MTPPPFSAPFRNQPAVSFTLNQYTGHLVQTRHPDDARARALALTPKGSRLATKVELASRERFLRVAEFLPDGMFLPVIASMRALNEAVAALASETSQKEMKR